jgi:hypothetical protein
MAAVDGPRRRQLVFVISPIGGSGSLPRIHADLFLEYIVRPALPEETYEVIRADEEDSPYAITEAMLGRILLADLCVADITGLNPNVMYELALAHAADKKVIIMTSDDGPPPFDIKDMRAIKYGLRVDEATAAVEQLRQKAQHEPSPQAFRSMLNPVATAFREWTDRQKIDAEQEGPDKAILGFLDRLDKKVDAIDRRTAAEQVRGKNPSSALQRVLERHSQIDSIVYAGSSSHSSASEDEIALAVEGAALIEQLETHHMAPARRLNDYLHSADSYLRLVAGR